MRSPRRFASAEPLEPRRLLTTWYVDAGSAAAAPDGSSWAAAYPDLQLALAAATSGDTVRVAGGTYRPTGTTDRTVSFVLKPGVSVYGGYAGSASPANPDARDAAAHPSVLSGDIGAVGSNADNSYHVLTAVSPTPGTTLDGLTFTAGNASPFSGTNHGGAISCTGGTLAVVNCTFTSNAAYGGGAIYLDGVTASVAGSSFTANTCYAGNQWGGAIWSRGSNLTVTGSSFTSNNCPIVGAAIATSSNSTALGSLAVSSSAFTSNTGGGGTIYSTTPVTITGSTFTANSGSNGAAIYLSNPGGGSTPAATVTSCSFVRNIASSEGAALITYAGGPLAITGCTFAGNSAALGGAVSIHSAANPVLANCLFVDNAATGTGSTSGRGGALVVQANATVVNSIFTANRAVNGGGAVAVLGGVTATLANCILYADSPSEIFLGTVFGSGPVGSAAVTYSDVQGGYAGAGNIDVDPRFYRNPGPGVDGVWGSVDDDYGDLRLLPGSPCVDVGSNAAIPAGVTTDLPGNPRTYDFPGAGTAGAATVDMGAYELTQNLGNVRVRAGQTLALPAGGYSFSATQLTIDPGGTLDLADGSLLVDYTGTSPLAAVRSALFSGRDGGAWDGTGIVSSAARTTANRGVGYAEAADLGLTTFAGQSVDATALLLKYTVAGDANLDGRINGDDYALTDRGRAKGLGTWVFGDFNYDAAVTNADYAILSAAAAPPTAPAPVMVAPAVSDETDVAAPAAVVTASPTPSPVVAPAKPAAAHTAKPTPAKAKPAKPAPVAKPKAKAKPKPAPKPKPKSPPHAAVALHKPSHAAYSSHPLSYR